MRQSRRIARRLQRPVYARLEGLQSGGDASGAAEEAAKRAAAGRLCTHAQLMDVRERERPPEIRESRAPRQKPRFGSRLAQRVKRGQRAHRTRLHRHTTSHTSLMKRYPHFPRINNQYLYPIDPIHKY